MIEIKPFKGLLYNQEKIRDVSSLTAPPYDCISPDTQARLYKLHPYNIVRLILGKDEEGDDKKINRYTRASNYLNDWITKKVLKKEELSSLYFYRQDYTLGQEKKNRLGFIALMNIDEQKDLIFPHELTHLGPKEDRLRLLSEVKANLSPIFSLFSDKNNEVRLIYEDYLKSEKPFIYILDDEQTRHRLWRISNQELIARLKNALSGSYVFIADGHHRYEVARQYRRQMRQRGDFSGKQPFDYILTYFTDLDSQDLTILPVHRVIKDAPANFFTVLEEYFQVESIKEKKELLLKVSQAAGEKCAFGLYQEGGYFLLRLKRERSFFLPADEEPLQELDTAVLQAFLFKFLRIPEKEIIYIRNEDEAVSMVDKQGYKAVFFLNPVKAEQIKKVALARRLMPSKSTYFYPKLLSGLVIYKFNEGIT